MTITRHGKPVARLMPQAAQKPDAADFLAKLKARRTERGGLGIEAVAAVREMRDEER